MSESDYLKKSTLFVRFWKYTYLVVALLVTIKIVFDGFSFYIARRGIDSELQSKGISIEYLTVINRRDRATLLDTLEARCHQRRQLALFRVFEPKSKDALDTAYRETWAAKEKLQDYIRKNGTGLADVAPFINAMDDLTWPTPSTDQLQKLIPPTKAGQQYIDFIAGVRKELETYTALTENYRAAIERSIIVKNAAEAIVALENRHNRLKAMRETQKKVLPADVDEVLSRYNVWVEALTGGFGNSAILDEMTYNLAHEDKTKLRGLNCKLLEEFYIAVNDQWFEVRELKGTTWAETSILGILLFPLRALSHWYNQYLLWYFSIPSSAQTLFVTLYLGALGALTLNVLRLSKVGFWRDYVDAPWGEVVVSPVVGAMAAFGVFLLGSTGLLLSADIRAGQSGSSSLSPYFIGLLGFLSGLLYDQAFGRVRDFGVALFTVAGTNARSGEPTDDDQSLAAMLKAAGAAHFAELVLKFSLAKELRDAEFVLMVPADSSPESAILRKWVEDTNVKAETVKSWMFNHLARGTIPAKDILTSDFTLLNEKGRKLLISQANGTLLVNTAKVLKEDLVWEKTRVLILDGDLH